MSSESRSSLSTTFLDSRMVRTQTRRLPTRSRSESSSFQCPKSLNQDLSVVAAHISGQSASITQPCDISERRQFLPDEVDERLTKPVDLYEDRRTGCSKCFAGPRRTSISRLPHLS